MRKCAQTLFATVKRMDTNGVKYAVRKNLPVNEAKKLAETLESRGHKQTYWVEEKEPPVRSPTGLESNKL